MTDTPLTSDGKPIQPHRATVSIMKACELIGVSRRTIYNWIAAGKVEYVRTAGGNIRVYVDTLFRDPINHVHPSNNFPPK